MMSSGNVLSQRGEDIMQRRGQKTTFQERIVRSRIGRSWTQRSRDRYVYGLLCLDGAQMETHL